MIFFVSWVEWRYSANPNSLLRSCSSRHLKMFGGKSLIAFFRSFSFKFRFVITFGSEKLSPLTLLLNTFSQVFKILTTSFDGNVSPPRSFEAMKLLSYWTVSSSRSRRDNKSAYVCNNGSLVWRCFVNEGN